MSEKKKWKVDKFIFDRIAKDFARRFGLKDLKDDFEIYWDFWQTCGKCVMRYHLEWDEPIHLLEHCDMPNPGILPVMKFDKRKKQYIIVDVAPCEIFEAVCGHRPKVDKS